MTDETLPQFEERILRFWKDRGIFEKSLAIRQARGKPFRFFEGPPTANAGPGIHHVLSRVFKDIICRYKTMRGFYVERKAGWDTHGLPVELQIEKELGIKTKSGIEKFGIGQFNKKAKGAVWRYKEEWEKFTERIGFWLDLKNPYITYDTSYMESLWWIIRQFWKSGLLEEDYKVVPYCPRCETPLSSHEVAQGYETTKDPSVYLRLRLKTINDKRRTINEYLLVWTTTPWTLPANIAVALNPSIIYAKYKIGDEFYWCAAQLPFDDADGAEIVEKRAGKSLIGLKYEPIFRTKIQDKKTNKAGEKIYRVIAGDFVSVKEGTGFVHIAPAFGEEDMRVAQKLQLPVIHNVSSDGKFFFTKAELKREPFFKKIRSLFVKDADKIIFEELRKRGALYHGNLEGTEHEYPFCWRCSAPLLYYAHKSWFVRMSRLQKELLANNANINWIPAHAKDGRFGEWLREVKDWAFSRERYWGTPLPIWQCAKCGRREVIGSLKELNQKTFKPNTFFMIRHGEAGHIKENYIACWPEASAKTSRLTDKGKREIERAAKALAKKRIDIIVSSDMVRMKETVAILKKHLRKAKVAYEPRLRELNAGIYNHRRAPEYRAFFKKPLEKFFRAPSRGETLRDAQMRYFAVWKELNRAHRGKRILIVGHGDPLWALEGKLQGLAPQEILKTKYIEPGKWRMLPQNDLPHNDEGETDLHRPYVDEVRLGCAKCASAMQRVGGIADVWFDSGSMPFAQRHYPFENKDCIDRNMSFPADYIAEGVDQTRGWFYTLLAVSTALGYRKPPYRNVICLGHILDEKGEKMSKSKGNVVNPWNMLGKYGADALRWYFYTVNPPGEPKKFSEQGLAKNRQELIVLANVLTFFTTYAPRKIKAQKSLKQNKFATGQTKVKNNVLDAWIMSRLAETTKNVTQELERYEVTQAARQISVFIDDVSRWYVRRSRRRFSAYAKGFGGHAAKKDYMAASSILAIVLTELSKLMAPFTPFLAEHIWREVTPRLAKKNPASVHLAAWPAQRAVSSADTILVKMQAVRELAALGLSLRQASGIKVRQPLKQFSVALERDAVRIGAEFAEILAEELNVKNVVFVRQLPETKWWARGETLRQSFRRSTGQTEKWHAALDTEITADLRAEGELRELIRNIQELRQELSLNPRDAISLYLVTTKTVEAELQRYIMLFKKQVGAVSVSFTKPAKFDAIKEYKRGDGAAMRIAVKKRK